MTTLAKEAHPVGTVVESTYAARWRGVVVASGRDHSLVKNGKLAGVQLYHAIPVSRDNKVVTLKMDDFRKVSVTGEPWDYLSTPTNVMVKITHDSKGKPLRKPKWVTMDSAWLVPVDVTPEDHIPEPSTEEPEHKQVLYRLMTAHQEVLRTTTEYHETRYTLKVQLLSGGLTDSSMKSKLNPLKKAKEKALEEYSLVEKEAKRLLSPE